MEREEILARIKVLLNNKYYVEEKDIKESDRFSDDIGMDSLDKVDSFMDVESEFNVSIPDEDVEEISTVGELIDYLLNKM